MSEKPENSRNKNVFTIVWIIGIGVLLTLSVYWIWYEDFKIAPNFVTLIGTSTSIIGLLLTFREANRARRSSESAERIAESTKKMLLSKINTVNISSIHGSINTIINEINSPPIYNSIHHLQRLVEVFEDLLQDNDFRNTGSYLEHYNNAKQILIDIRANRTAMGLKIKVTRKQEIIKQLTEMESVLKKVLNDKTKN